MGYTSRKGNMKGEDENKEQEQGNQEKGIRMEIKRAEPMKPRKVRMGKRSNSMNRKERNRKRET